MTDQPPAEILEHQIRSEALASGVTVRVQRGTSSGFGLENVAILDVASEQVGSVVRLWDEGSGDFWIEMTGRTAAWWRQGRKETTLAAVVIALVEGNFTIEGDRITVMPAGCGALTLRDRM